MSKAAHTNTMTTNTKPTKTRDTISCGIVKPWGSGADANQQQQTKP